MKDLPQNIDDISVAVQVMEEAPLILGEVETAILLLETEIGKREGQLLIDNKDEKTNIQKAILKTDQELIKGYDALAILKGQQKAWTSAFQSAKQFHKAQTLS